MTSSFTFCLGIISVLHIFRKVWFHKREEILLLEVLVGFWEQVFNYVTIFFEACVFLILFRFAKC